MNDHLELFHLWLQDNEFKLDKTKTQWTGYVRVDWRDAEMGDWKTAEHQIAISLPEGFPFHAPIIYSKDDPPLASSWHLNPGSPPSLCLWDSETGWKPYFTAHKLLNRIHDWFYYYHTDAWPTNSQVPDLHLYLKKFGTVIIGEEWEPSIDTPNGKFTLWHSPKFIGVLPDIASCDLQQFEPEPRIASNITLGSDRQRVKGVWFRLPSPFVPSNRLNTLFNQIGALLQKPSGWSVKKCIAAIGVKAPGKGFPIAIGYPDNNGEERWLFLWGKFPDQTKKQFKWSARQNLYRIEVMGFQTALASVKALLRRAAHISDSLVSKSVTLFGVGALGSSVALLLAKAGVGEIRLIDSDHLMPGNAMRHVCGLNYVGFPKTSATEFVIHRHNPDCSVKCYEKTWDKHKLHDYMRGCDVVIDATGNTNFSFYLNKICVELNQPVMFAAAYRRARVGRVIIRLDNQDPCLACYQRYQAVWSDDEYPLIPANPDEGFLEDGCGAITEEAISLDVESVANFSARQVVKLLQGTHDGNNLRIIVNEPLSDADSPILHSPGIHLWTNKAYSNCSTCRT